MRDDVSGTRRWIRVSLFLFIFLFMSISTLGGCGGGEGGGDGDSRTGQVDLMELWNQSEETGKQAKSFTLEINVFYQGTQFGTGLVQSTKMKVNGEDFSVETSLFGQPVSEMIQVGGNRYTKSITDNKWKREKASAGDTSEKNEIGKLSSIPDSASSTEYLGTEELDGQPAHRLRFFLDPEKLAEVLPSVPKEQIAENKGATIDVWIRQSDLQRIKYEMVVSNAKINDRVGYGDLRVVIAIRDINEPVLIKPPV